MVCNFNYTSLNETQKPKSITKDGVTYNLVETKGNEKGKVVEGLTEVTYVYKKVTSPQKVGDKLPNTGSTSTNTGLASLALAGLALTLRRKKNK